MSSKSVSTEIITSKIFILRGQKVMFDRDLAKLYGLGTRDLNKAVTRNMERFPVDFMFQLNKGELDHLMFQFGTSSHGGTRKMPRVFTEQGVAMLSSVLRSKRAVEVNIIIMRAFVRIREILMSHKELALKLNAMEQKLTKHDKEIMTVFEAIRRLMREEEKPKGKIGFHP